MCPGAARPVPNVEGVPSGHSCSFLPVEIEERVEPRLLKLPALKSLEESVQQCAFVFCLLMTRWLSSVNWTSPESTFYAEC